MITLEQVKIIKEKKKDNPDQMNLFGDNSGKKKKYTPPSKEKSDAIQSRSANRDAKKYASGEYPKIGGGDRMTPKSKGPGASTGGTNIPPATVGGKSKGTTPVKVNITKPVKQSEVSKKAKQFTNKIDVKKITKDADRLVRRAEKGDKGARKQIFKVLDKKFKKLSPADQEIEAKKMYDVQKKMGRKFNPKTGNFEGPDTKFQKSISKIKDSKGKRITSGPVSVTAGPKIRKRVETIRDTRATKAGMPDPFKVDTSKASKQVAKDFGTKPVTTSAPGFGIGMTSGQIKAKAMDKNAFVKTQPKDVTLPKSFTDFSKKLKAYRVDRDIERKIKNPKLDISKVIKKRKSETPVQQSIPGTGGNRNIKKTFKKKTSRQKPPSGGGSSKYTQGSLFDKPPGGGSGGGGGKPSGSGSSGGGGGKPPGGSIVTTGGGSGGVDPDDVFKGPIPNKGSGNMSNKQFKKFRKDQKKMFKKFMKQMKQSKAAETTVNVGRKTRSAQDALNLAKKIKASRTPTAGKVLKNTLKFARKNPGKAGLIATAVVGGGMALKSYLNRKDDLNINKDFAKTTTIKNPSGQNVRFRYSNRKDKDGNPIYKDQASSFLTKDKKNRIGGTIPGGLTKFRTGQYTANYKSGGKVGGRINIDKNMRSSAFEKQLKKAEKGTGFFGKQTQKDKDFLRKYKNATRPTAVK